MPSFRLSGTFLCVCLAVSTHYQLIDLWKHVLKTPKTLLTSTEFTSQVVILVVSKRQSVAPRQVIRETWARGLTNVFFLIGEACPLPPRRRRQLTCEPSSTNASLSERTAWQAYTQFVDKYLIEELSGGDLIQVKHNEVPSEQVELLRAGYDWVTKKTKANWVVKVYDDSFVHVDAIFRFLMGYNHFDPFVIGGIPTPNISTFLNLVPPYQVDTTPLFISRPALTSQDGANVVLPEETRYSIKRALQPAEYITTSEIIDHTDNCIGEEACVIGHGISSQEMQRCSMISQVVEQSTGPEPAKHTEHVCNEITGKFWDAFKSIVHTLNDINANYTASHGTVLGWYRDCDLFMDLDFDLELVWFMENIDTLHGALINSGWKQVHIFGVQGEIGYEEAWMKLGVKADLFSQTFIHGEYIDGLTVRGKTYPCFANKTRHEPHQWNGVEFLVPAPIEEYLVSQYGTTWPEKHISGYNWALEPFKTENGRRHCSKSKMPSLRAAIEG